MIPGAIHGVKPLWPWQQWLAPRSDEPTRAQQDAAILVQKHFRGFTARYHFAVALHALSGKPSLRRAREYMREMQPHTLEKTEVERHKVVPLPLSCPIECFKAFGPGVYTYMLWMRLMKRVFAVAFAFALGNMAHNWAGGEYDLNCGGNCWLSVHTIGNVGSLNASYGVSELLVLCVLLYGMFASVSIVHSEGSDGGNGGKASMSGQISLPPTLADLTVMLEGLPAVPPSEAAIKTAMGAFGAVHTVHVAFAIRDVLLRTNERQRRLQDLHAARCELCVLRVAQPTAPELLSKWGLSSDKKFQRKLDKNQKQQAACRAQIQERDQRLRDHDQESAALLHQPRDCTGHAFVTFVDADAAARATAAINGSTQAEDGAVKALSELMPPEVQLRASRAPHPTDIQWGNLEFSSQERRRRHLISTCVMLLLSSFGSVVIAAITYASGNNLFASLVNGNLPPGFLGVVCSLLLALALAIPTILSNVMLFFSVPQLAEKYEMHHTHGASAGLDPAISGLSPRLGSSPLPSLQLLTQTSPPPPQLARR